MIRYFTSDSRETLSEVYLYALGIALCPFLLALLQHPLYFSMNRIGLKMRIAVCSLIYRKVLYTTEPAHETFVLITYATCADPEVGDRGSAPPPPPEKSQK